MMNEKDGSNNKGKITIIILSSPQTDRLQSSTTASLLNNFTDNIKPRALTPQERLTKLTDSIEQHVKATYLDEGLIDKHRYERFVKFSSDEKNDLRQNNFELYKRVLKNRGWKAMAAYVTSQFSADKGANVQVADDFDDYCKDKERATHLPELITYNVARQHPIPRASTIKLKMNDRNARIPIAVFHKITSKQVKEKVVQRMIDYLDREVGAAVDTHFHTSVVSEIINTISYEIEKYVRPTVPSETEADEEGIDQFYNFIMTTIGHVLAGMEKQLLQVESYQMLLPVIEEALPIALNYVGQKIKDSSSMYPNHLPQLDATLRGIYAATESSQKILEGLDGRYSTLRCESVVNTTLVSACDPEILNSVFSNMWIQEATETIQTAARKSTTTNTLPQKTEKPQTTVKPIHTIDNSPKVKEISDTAQKAIGSILGFASDQKRGHLKNRLEKIWRNQSDIDRPRLVAGFNITMDLTKAEARKKTAKEAGFFFYEKSEKIVVRQADNSDLATGKSGNTDKKEPPILPISQLLNALVKSPEILTGYGLILLLEERGYKFVSKKDFLKQANSIIGPKTRKSATSIQKKAVNILKKDEIAREYDKAVAAGGVSYQAIGGEPGEAWRIVKQGNTIIWMGRHDKYEKILYSYFTKEKNYDDPAYRDSTPTKSLITGNSEKILVNPRYTETEGDQLSKGA